MASSNTTPDIRVTNRDGIVYATVITETPEAFRAFGPYHEEMVDNYHVLRYQGSNVFDVVMSTMKNIEYSDEMNLITRSAFAPFRYTITNSSAIPPTRARHSDSGYDVTVISKAKTFGKVTLYGTGIKVQPPSGFYFDLVPRSSIIKSGYMLANSVGIIDQSYTGEIMVPLMKMDPDAPDLELPAKIAQLVPRRWYGLRPVEDETEMETMRGDGGFGSTNNV